MVREQQDHEKWSADHFFDSHVDVTDDQLSDSVKELLSNSDRIDAHDVHVRVDNHNVILTGMVNDEEARESIDHMVRLIEGVGEVRNHLNVEYGPLRS